MEKRINVNDFDKIAKKLMEMKATAEAEGTEEAWNAYAFERDGWDGPSMGVDFNEDTGKFTLAEGYIADEDGWVVLRDAVSGPDAQ